MFVGRGRGALLSDRKRKLQLLPLRHARRQKPGLPLTTLRRESLGADSDLNGCLGGRQTML
jgi:hypothetical protein